MNHPASHLGILMCGRLNDLWLSCIFCKCQMTSKVIRHNWVFLWNNLPDNIRQQVTLSSFKTKLKLYLFCMYCILAGYPALLGFPPSFPPSLLTSVPPTLRSSLPPPPPRSLTPSLPIWLEPADCLRLAVF